MNRTAKILRSLRNHYNFMAIQVEGLTKDISNSEVRARIETYKEVANLLDELMEIELKHSEEMKE